MRFDKVYACRFMVKLVRESGNRLTCPSCGSNGLINYVSRSLTELNHGVNRYNFLCGGCGYRFFVMSGGGRRIVFSQTKRDRRYPR